MGTLILHIIYLLLDVVHLAGLLDLEYQNSTDVFSASWHGFIDFESYIYNYEWCIGNTNATDEFNIMACTSVGLQTSASRELNVPVVNGS